MRGRCTGKMKDKQQSGFRLAEEREGKAGLYS